jgi:hypothetical protein
MEMMIMSKLDLPDQYQYLSRIEARERRAALRALRSILGRAQITADTTILVPRSAFYRALRAGLEAQLEAWLDSPRWDEREPIDEHIARRSRVCWEAGVKEASSLLQRFIDEEDARMKREAS